MKMFSVEICPKCCRAYTYPKFIFIVYLQFKFNLLSYITKNFIKLY